MKKEKFNIKRKEVIMILAALSLGIGIGIAGSIAKAAENPTYAVVNSYGALTFDDGDETNNNGYLHDLVIDTSDLKNLANATDILKQTTDELKQTTDELNNNLNGCSFEQEGDEFYIIGADSVRKKLGSGGLELLRIRHSNANSSGPYGTYDTYFKNVGASNITITENTPGEADGTRSITIYGSNQLKYTNDHSFGSPEVPTSWTQLSGNNIDINEYKYILIRYYHHGYSSGKIYYFSMQ